MYFGFSFCKDDIFFNFSLLSKEDNENASNKDFVTKKADFYENNQFGLTYSSANSAIKSLTSYNFWNFENIKTRQFEMAEVALKVWSL